MISVFTPEGICGLSVFAVFGELQLIVLKKVKKIFVNSAYQVFFVIASHKLDRDFGNLEWQERR